MHIVGMLQHTCDHHKVQCFSPHILSYNNRLIFRSKVQVNYTNHSPIITRKCHGLKGRTPLN